MEAAGLYLLAAKYNRKALALLTISDHILTGEETTAEERETTFDDMMLVALESIL
jgi:purine-nucleoside phosphorylase